MNRIGVGMRDGLGGREKGAAGTGAAGMPERVGKTGSGKVWGKRKSTLTAGGSL